MKRFWSSHILWHWFHSVTKWLTMPDLFRSVSYLLILKQMWHVCTLFHVFKVFSYIQLHITKHFDYTWLGWMRILTDIFHVCLCRCNWHHAWLFLPPLLPYVYIYLLVHFFLGQDYLEQPFISLWPYRLPTHSHGCQQILVRDWMKVGINSYLGIIIHRKLINLYLYHCRSIDGLISPRKRNADVPLWNYTLLRTQVSLASS